LKTHKTSLQIRTLVTNFPVPLGPRRMHCSLPVLPFCIMTDEPLHCVCKGVALSAPELTMNSIFTEDCDVLASSF
jgi:hypothetical protein